MAKKELLHDFACSEKRDFTAKMSIPARNARHAAELYAKVTHDHSDLAETSRTIFVRNEYGKVFVISVKTTCEIVFHVEIVNQRKRRQG